MENASLIHMLEAILPYHFKYLEEQIVEQMRNTKEYAKFLRMTAKGHLSGILAA